MPLRLITSPLRGRASDSRARHHRGIRVDCSLRGSTHQPPSFPAPQTSSRVRFRATPVTANGKSHRSSSSLIERQPHHPEDDCHHTLNIRLDQQTFPVSRGRTAKTLKPLPKPDKDPCTGNEIMRVPSNHEPSSSPSLVAVRTIVRLSHA